MKKSLLVMAQQPLKVVAFAMLRRRERVRGQRVNVVGARMGKLYDVSFAPPPNQKWR